jgi:5-aminolevulinate synthase
MHNTLDEHGSGAGGTRNISGHNKHVESLETTLADLHHKEAALVCTSCYVANEATLSTLGSILPECVIFSDSMNHASMIQGIRHSGAKKVIFRHNDMHDLEARLAAVPLHVPKIIAFESVYSMSGTVSDIRHICDLAKKYAAITFLDEAHGVGLYGPSGAGVAEHLDYDAHLAGHHRGTVMDRVDIITGTLAKAYGCVGGYIAGKGTLVDVVRSLTPSFIFTTSLPPAVLAGAEAAVNYQRQTGADRKAQQVHVRSLKNALRKSNIPILENETHIIPILVGDAAMARKASELLLSKWHIYIQAINAPTVPVGQEILRITPTSGHSKEMQDHLVTALKDVWHELGIKQATQWLMYKGHTVDQDIADALLPGATPLWTDQQLDHIGSAKSAV